MTNSPAQSNPMPETAKPSPDAKTGAPLTDAEKKAEVDKAQTDKVQPQAGYAMKS